MPGEPLREDHPDRARREDPPVERRHRSGKRSPGSPRPAVLGPITAQPASRAAASTQAVSCKGTCSVSTTSFWQPASIASSAAVLTPSGETGPRRPGGDWPPSRCGRTYAGTPQHFCSGALGVDAADRGCRRRSCARSRSCPGGGDALDQDALGAAHDHRPPRPQPRPRGSPRRPSDRRARPEPRAPGPPPPRRCRGC